MTHRTAKMAAMNHVWLAALDNAALRVFENKVTASTFVRMLFCEGFGPKSLPDDIKDTQAMATMARTLNFPGSDGPERCAREFLKILTHELAIELSVGVLVAGRQRTSFEGENFAAAVSVSGKCAAVAESAAAAAAESAESAEEPLAAEFAAAVAESAAAAAAESAAAAAEPPAAHNKTIVIVGTDWPPPDACRTVAQLVAAAAAKAARVVFLMNGTPFSCGQTHDTDVLSQLVRRAEDADGYGVTLALADYCEHTYDRALERSRPWPCPETPGVHEEPAACQLTLADAEGPIYLWDGTGFTKTPAFDDWYVGRDRDKWYKKTSCTRLGTKRAPVVEVWGFAFKTTIAAEALGTVTCARAGWVALVDATADMFVRRSGLPDCVEEMYLLSEQNVLSGDRRGRRVGRHVRRVVFLGKKIARDWKRHLPRVGWATTAVMPLPGDVFEKDERVARCSAPDGLLLETRGVATALEEVRSASGAMTEADAELCEPEYAEFGKDAGKLVVYGPEASEAPQNVEFRGPRASRDAVNGDMASVAAALCVADGDADYMLGILSYIDNKVPVIFGSRTELRHTLKVIPGTDMEYMSVEGAEGDVSEKLVAWTLVSCILRTECIADIADSIRERYRTLRPAGAFLRAVFGRK
jgi:hypothetical protein